jgi:hypothetical protein
VRSSHASITVTLTNIPLPPLTDSTRSGLALVRLSPTTTTTDVKGYQKPDPDSLRLCCPRPLPSCPVSRLTARFAQTTGPPLVHVQPCASGPSLARSGTTSLRAWCSSAPSTRAYTPRAHMVRIHSCSLLILLCWEDLFFVLFLSCAWHACDMKLVALLPQSWLWHCWYSNCGLREGF